MKDPLREFDKAIDRIAELERERDEAREAARWLLNHLDSTEFESDALVRWPWLEEGGDE